MVSLGREAYCGSLKIREDLTVAGRINGDLTVDGSITAKSKHIGDANNLGELHHSGSIFYIKWSAVHQAASLTTVDASDEVTWATTAAHGLAQNDVVHVSAPPPNPTPITEVNGIPAAELTGTFTVQSATTNTFTVQVATAATSAGTSTQAIPLVRVDRYKYTDMNATNNTWSVSTTLPAPSHTNTEIFYY